MAADPVTPPAHQPKAQERPAYLPALRLALLWGPLTAAAALRLPALLADPDSSNAVKTLAFFVTLAVCWALLVGCTVLEVRRIHRAEPGHDVGLLQVLVIGIAILQLSVIAVWFTGFEIAYSID